MSGAQGAQPMGETTPTTYESVGGGENRTRTDLRSREDQGAIQIDKVQDKVDEPAARKVDDRAFDAKQVGHGAGADAGATGTGAWYRSREDRAVERMVLLLCCCTCA